jgi:2-keto-4-pentenoate hydratase/2-oxohepta-3-ene-1,7-dioic acid hydratase in catechol pathway
MRTANVDGRACLVLADRLMDIEAASGGQFPADPMALLDRWAELRAWAGVAGSAGPAGAATGIDLRTLDRRRLGAPVPRPRQVFAVASNYRDRPIVVPGSADLPVVFTKFPSCIVGPLADVPLPAETVDWEVELVVVIAREAHKLAPDDVWDAVAGVTVGQDFSERALQLGGPGKQFCLGKSFPCFGPTGPVLVTVDELPEPDDLALTCAVNGETVQQARTSQMIFPVPQLVSRLSQACWLLPGDLIFTGTPGGLGMSMDPPRYLRIGDEVISGIEGIGELRNLCTSHPQRENTPLRNASS